MPFALAMDEHLPRWCITEHMCNQLHVQSSLFDHHSNLGHQILIMEQRAANNQGLWPVQVDVADACGLQCHAGAMEKFREISRVQRPFGDVGQTS